jgi:hypothetical protein
MPDARDAKPSGMSVAEHMSHDATVAVLERRGDEIALPFLLSSPRAPESTKARVSRVLFTLNRSGRMPIDD